jgi:hypothetical protein
MPVVVRLELAEQVRPRSFGQFFPLAYPIWRLTG